MSAPDEQIDTMSLELAYRVDQACRQFERATRAGERPSIEQTLAQAVADDREALLFELLPLDIELRLGMGERPGPTDYLARFPAYPNLIAEAFRSAPATGCGWPVVPGYRVLSELGRGGMGVVYKAEETALDRVVALKVLSRSIRLGPRYRERFEREAQAAARLHHTNIVPVFAVGEHDGAPYHAMQYIQGEGLDAVLERLRNGGEARPAPAEGKAYWRWVARLGSQAAAALEHAHSRGVLHRDIKPSNLLLDAQGTLWVTDFGLAKVEGGGDLTATGDVLGTLRYLPPEAFAGHADARGDVYSLGLTLYELLALRPGFDAADQSKLFHQLVIDTPPPLESLRPAVPRDLATIVHKAIERESRHRYASAAELADDLRRFLNDEPIRARPMNALQRLGRWARRHRAVAALSAATLLALVVGTAVSTYFAFEASARAKREQEAATDARQAKRQSDLQAARLELKEALRQAEAGSVDVALFGLVEALRLAPSEAKEFRRAVRLNFAAWGQQLPTLRYAIHLYPRPDIAEDIWIHPIGADGKQFAFWAPGRPLEVRETASGRVARAWALAAKELPLALGPDGDLLLTRTGSVDEPCSIRLRRLADGQPAGKSVDVPPLSPRQALPERQSLVLSPRWVMTGGATITAPQWGPRRFWNLSRGARYPLQLPDDGAPTHRVVPTRDGKAVAFLFHAGETHNRSRCRAEAYDIETGRPATLPLALVGGVIPHVDREGRTILSIEGDETALGSDGSVRWWDAASLRLLETWRPRRKAWFSYLLPDSQALAAYGQDDRTRLFDLDTGLQRGGDLHLPGIYRIGERPGGTYPGLPVLLTHLGDGVLRAWDTAHLLPQLTSASNPRNRSVLPDRPLPRFTVAALAPDGRQAVLGLGGRQDYGRLVEVATGDVVGPPLQQRYLHHIAFSGDGRLVATAPHHFWIGGAPIEVHLHDRRTGRPHVPPVAMPTFIHSLAFSPDGRTVAVGCIGSVRLLDAETGRVRAVLKEASFAASLAFSSDSSVLAVAYRSGWPGKGAGVRLWDIIGNKPIGAFHSLASGTGGPEIRFLDHERLVMVFDPSAGTLFLYDPATGEPVSVQRVPGRINGVADRPGTGIVALLYVGGTVSQWDLRAGVPVGEPMIQPDTALAVRFSPDGRVLAVVCKDNVVRLWDSATGLPFGPPLMHATEVRAVGFSSDSQEVITLSAAGVARRWPLAAPAPDDPNLAALWVKAATGRELHGRETALLAPDAWDGYCQELRQRWPEAGIALRRLTQSPSADWHQARARDAEATGNTHAQLWQLERLSRLQPGNWRIAIRRAAVLAAVGELRAAEDILAEGASSNSGIELCERLVHEGAIARNLERKELARWYGRQCLALLIRRSAW